MTAAPAPRYIDNIGIVFARANDRERFERLLDGGIVGAELDEANGTQWVTESVDGDVEGHAIHTSLTLIGMSEDAEGDVEGHYYPGTYAPRFDLQTRDIQAKEALQQAIREDRIRGFEIEDRDGQTVRINLLSRAGLAVSTAGAAVASFVLARAEGAQQMAHESLRYKL